ncbi:MAG: hypothetical protein ACUVWV_01430 [Thermodesulfobacteriota bacterium]
MISRSFSAASGQFLKGTLGGDSWLFPGRKESSSLIKWIVYFFCGYQVIYATFLGVECGPFQDFEGDLLVGHGLNDFRAGTEFGIRSFYVQLPSFQYSILNYSMLISL